MAQSQSRTEKFQLPYLTAPGPVTPAMEAQRYLTLDVQMEALFSVLGNGIINGWELSFFLENGTTKTNNTIYIKPGQGHINYVAAETFIWETVVGLWNGTNYIYATIDEDTFISKLPIFFTSNIPLSQENIISLGIVDIENDICTRILPGDRREIGFITILLNSILTHQHGKDGITPVDLNTDVKGILASENLADIPAERITTGIISPERFSFSHEDLLKAGTITHEDIDSLIEKLQKPNQRLFGDISATNLLKMIIELKKVYPNCDRFFRNLIVVVPGLDNNTFDNPKSFLDPAYAHESTRYENGQTNYVSLYDLDEFGGNDLITFNQNAAVVDYKNSYIAGVVSSGSTTHAVSIDTEPEFRRGSFYPDYILISSIGNEFAYGYGYGYGEGLDFFNVFGISSGLTDEYGNLYCYGYGTTDFEEVFTEKYGYGYGYEYIFGRYGGGVGNVNIKLQKGNYDTAFYHQGDVMDDPDYNSIVASGSLIDPCTMYADDDTKTSSGFPNINNILMHKYHYIPQLGESIQQISGERLIFNISGDENHLDWEDWSTYTKLYLVLKNTSGAPIKIFDFVDNPSPNLTNNEVYYNGVYPYGWQMTITDKNGVAGSTIDVFPFEKYSLCNLDSRVPPWQELSGYDSSVSPWKHTSDYSLNLLKGENTGIDMSHISKITIKMTSGYSSLKGGEISPFDWNTYMYQIAIGGSEAYSDSVTSNKIDKLYIVIPSNEAAKLETISWVADEPSDSRIAIFLRSVDASLTGDGFALLEGATWGNPYTNKARGSEEAKPSGSVVNEQNGTHVEIKAVLYPSIDHALTPILHSITLRYSTAGGEQQQLYATDDDYVEHYTMYNVKIDANSLQILDSTEVKSRRLGHRESFKELYYGDPNTGGYHVISRPDYYGNKLPMVLDQYLSEASVSTYNVVASVKKMSDGNLVIVDTLNDRVVIVDSITNEFVRGFYGGKSYSVICTAAPKFQLVFVHYNSVYGVLYAGFTHSVTDVKINYWSINTTEGDNYFLDDEQGDTCIILPCNLTATGGGIVKITLGDYSKANLDEMLLSGGDISLTLPIDLAAYPAITPNNTIVPANIDSLSFNKKIESWEIYYDLISAPIDVKIDSSDNLLIAQAIKSGYSMTGAPSIYKFSPSYPPCVGGTSLLSVVNGTNPLETFLFDSTYFGSVEEFLNSAGEQILLIADVNQKRVVLYNRNSTPPIVIPIYTVATEISLYPSCATFGSNGKYYITLTDKGEGNGGKVVEKGSEIKFFLDGHISNPKDVYYLSTSDKLLIST